MAPYNSQTASGGQQGKRSRKRNRRRPWRQTNIAPRALSIHFLFSTFNNVTIKQFARSYVTIQPINRFASYFAWETILFCTLTTDCDYFVFTLPLLLGSCPNRGEINKSRQVWDKKTKKGWYTQMNIALGSTVLFTASFLIIIGGIKWQKAYLLLRLGVLSCLFFWQMIIDFYFLLALPGLEWIPVIVQTVIGAFILFITLLDAAAAKNEYQRKIVIKRLLMGVAVLAGVGTFVFRDNLNLLIAWTILGTAGLFFVVGVVTGVVKFTKWLIH